MGNVFALDGQPLMGDPFSFGFSFDFDEILEMADQRMYIDKLQRR